MYQATTDLCSDPCFQTKKLTERKKGNDQAIGRQFTKLQTHSRSYHEKGEMQEPEETRRHQIAIS
jgi:hypothetical protein